MTSKTSVAEARCEEAAYMLVFPWNVGLDMTVLLSPLLFKRAGRAMLLGTLRQRFRVTTVDLPVQPEHNQARIKVEERKTHAPTLMGVMHEQLI